MSAPGRTVARGYGPAHKRLRERWRPAVQAGEVACACCGSIILPGEPWDLGHRDGSRREYAGPEHRRCNRATERHGVKRTPRKRTRLLWAFGGDPFIPSGENRTSRRW